MEQARPRGRRPAGADTRGAIVAAARAEFSERGFEAASMRAVARRADVDPALVRHYFPDKGELFAVSVLPQGVDPREVADRALDGAVDGLGQRLLTEVLTLWGRDDGVAFRAVLGAIAAGDERTQAFVAFLSRNVFDRIVAAVPGDDREHRTALVGSQVMGLLALRYGLRMEPVASMPAGDLARLAGPTIDRYLTGPLPRSSGAPS